MALYANATNAETDWDGTRYEFRWMHVPVVCGTSEEIGKYINDNNLRVTSHPGPFNVLTSPKEHVVKNCIHDLSVQGEIFDLMNLTESPFNKINIHIGGAYGDKIESMKRFCKNFERYWPEK